ncbi:MAG: nuclear transport factor 2 family protein [Acidobacteriota bacterium]|nr:nuclear transport factor 2 family protein [Acidobacteriota bacterium]
MQVSEASLRNRLSVTCGLALVWSFTLALGSAGAEVVVQSCADLVEPQDGDGISSPAEVPGVYLARVNEGDVGRVIDLFATDAVHRGPDGQVRKGRAAIREFYEGILAGGARRLAVGRSVADSQRVAFELVNLGPPCNDDDPALAVDVMDINEDGQIQEFTVFSRPRP